ncbi:MAG: helix-turn-helix domain-containing protein [Leptospiraceae bacterium]|nr:helix-turn-helix domain-containing protein [Leptospiraceae bacterium]
MKNFGKTLRLWREINKKSQMDLALDVDISTKHVSYIENGKSQPSRQLVLKISECLKVPFRQRNALLISAGYTPEFKENSLESSDMKIIKDILENLLKKQEPYPAFVVNPGYRILLKNSGYDKLIRNFASDDAIIKYDNVMKLMFAEDGLRNSVKGIDAIENFLLERLLHEMASSQNNELSQLYRFLSRKQKNKNCVFEESFIPHLPVLNLEMEKNGKKVSLVSTITTLRTPLDITTQELRIELFFPVDEETKVFFEAKK